MISKGRRYAAVVLGSGLSRETIALLQSETRVDSDRLLSPAPGRYIRIFETLIERGILAS